MAVVVEATFMNGLPFSLRAAAQELYLKESLESLVKMRLHDVSKDYLNAYSLTEEQWKMVLNVLILTQLSQFTLGKHISKDGREQLIFLVATVLDMQEASNDEILEFLEEKAKIFAVWYAKLLKLGNK
ncbi:hypothetical protein THMIRHAM_10610 [Thiomicrorhabdus immobilis]|uniref:Uncharacterized protein n=1 Tax=Thiomicrorhabdus immobilis TaxID=2791037 RepID=A0ABN6CW76_9GAMM|nr:hypothetical protein [Thiomicrorhabdus immobilis]BCN93276.1 hypothetical protein THMIRHAM_10610 [Thiomicrorhabdus immobilis]